MTEITIGVFVAEAVIFLLAFGQWASLSQWLSKERALSSGMKDLAADGDPNKFFEEHDASGSILFRRWSALSDLAYCTQNIPVDQSFLDDEVEAGFDIPLSALRSKAGIAVLIGLAGTLTGLSFGVQNLQMALPKPGQTLNIGEFSDKMGATISGFGSAFYSALAGVVVAVLIGLLAAHMQAATAAFALHFRTFSRTTLLRRFFEDPQQTLFGKQLQQLAQAVRGLNQRLPSAEALTQSVDNLNSLNATLMQSATNVTQAYDRSISKLDKPNTISQGLDRLEVLLKEHTERTERIISESFESIEASARIQTQMAEELLRLVLDAPMEVASSRLVVSDRQEFQKLQSLLESKLDRVERSVNHTATRVDEVASYNFIKRVRGWFRR